MTVRLYVCQKRAATPVEQNPSSESNRSSGKEENLRTLLNPESSLRHLQKLVTLPYRKPDQTIHVPTPLPEDMV